jgi:transcriptional regulator with XRE-family HTH domain
MARSDIGTRLRHARKLRGLSQYDLAKSAGVKQASVSNLETGSSRSFKGTTLVSFAQILDVSPDWLASGKGQMTHVDTPLPPEALRHAREWLKLAPEVRVRVADMVREMVKTSSADQIPVPDEKVEAAYGSPGRKKPQK